MLRPSPNHGTQRLPNDDDDDYIHSVCIMVYCAVIHIGYHRLKLMILTILANYISVLKGYTGDGTKNGCHPMRCRDKPCYRGVPCFDTPTGPVCGQCPTGLTGDGTRSGCQSIVYRARRLRCSDGPCFRDGACRDTMDGFECGPCPERYIGDGTARGCHRIE